MQEVIEQLRHLSSAEDFLRFFDIAFDEKVVNVRRLHILKRFFQYIEQQKGLPSNNATAVLALADAIRQIANGQAVDIIFAGKQTIDGDTAQVGPGIARRLSVQLLTYVSRIVETDLDPRTIVVERASKAVCKY
ncbi:electron transfer flavoprotein [Paraburkholderia sp. BL18I3N2]|uniref:nitrogenase-stabilizing/protective protein NifW n=1 Tax=unclassified Paraburkholderia TaxID=2615204 RepID=UPI000D49CFA7|nr:MULTISPECIES: nitrogenase-stabilizing/protective protein NifW [unclassified Paraburkholderia]PRX26169.1 electron transfer flavoprotein [Paraburkholderia sp. BL18I3N2]PRX95392.1 electron transfer flavoprotein [Paraburkholderia sp. BL25I1N1]